MYHCHKPRVKRTWDGPVVGLTYKSGPFNMGGPFIISDSTVSTVPYCLLAHGSALCSFLPFPSGKFMQSTYHYAVGLHASVHKN